MAPHEVSQDSSRGEWFPWYPGTIWVYQFLPQPSQGQVLQGFPPNLKTNGAPLAPCGACLLPFVGPAYWSTLVRIMQGAFHAMLQQFHQAKHSKHMPAFVVTQWTIGNPPRGPGGPRGFSDLKENLCKTLPWGGLGGNGHTQRVPGYHTNHSPRKKSWETSWETYPSTKLCFSGPLFGPKKGARKT